MIYKIFPSTRFKKDLKTAIRRGYNIQLLENVINILVQGKQLADTSIEHLQ